MQKEGPSKLIKVVKSDVPAAVLSTNNSKGLWEYGYNEDYNFVVISRDGTIGDVVEIQGLRIALPETPKRAYSTTMIKSQQYWQKQEYPKELKRIKTVTQWNETTESFKDKWVE